MTPLFTFILGLLIGWLIEWLIDYFYWRRRYAQTDPAHANQSAAVRRAASLQDQDSPPVPVVPDDLKVIKGVGPVIERKLNEAGIYTY